MRYRLDLIVDPYEYLIVEPILIRMLRMDTNVSWLDSNELNYVHGYEC